MASRPPVPPPPPKKRGPPPPVPAPPKARKAPPPVPAAPVRRPPKAARKMPPPRKAPPTKTAAPPSRPEEDTRLKQEEGIEKLMQAREELQAAKQKEMEMKQQQQDEPRRMSAAGLRSSLTNLVKRESGGSPSAERRNPLSKLGSSLKNMLPLVPKKEFKDGSAPELEGVVRHDPAKEMTPLEMQLFGGLADNFSEEEEEEEEPQKKAGDRASVIVSDAEKEALLGSLGGLEL